MKELGVKQESLFWWVDGELIVPTDQNHDLCAIEDAISNIRKSEHFPAFTVAELGEMLPSSVGGINAETNGFQYRPGATGWVTYWWNYKANTYNYFALADTEADARAKMLIYLLENSLIQN